MAGSHVSTDPMKTTHNKKVLLRDRKRHTTRCVTCPGGVDRQTDRHV